MKRDDFTIPVTFGSVCSGIEAASSAWYPLGWRAEWLAEIDPFAARVLHHHYGAGRPLHMPSSLKPGLSLKDVAARRAAIKAVSMLPDTVAAGAPRNLGDMTEVAALVRAGGVACVAVLVGGTPCQAFSIAGLRNSLDDARGQLTIAFVDLANENDAARHVRGEPAGIIVWENVPGVLNTPDNAFGCFLGALAGEDCPLVAPGGKWPNAGCVYGPQRTIAWRVLDAQYFGVAQRRRRVFVVASARYDIDPTEILFEFDGVRRDFAPSRETAEDLAGTVRASAARRGEVKDECGLGLYPVGFGVPGVDLGRPLTASPHGYRIDFETETLVAGILLTNGKAAGSATQQDAESGMLVPIAFDTTQITSPGNHSNPRPGDACHPLSARAHAPAIAFSCKDNGRDATEELAPTLRSMGHSGSHANGGGQMAVCVTGEVTHTLKSECFDASEDGTGQGQPIVVVELQGEGDGELVNGTREGARNLPARSMRGVLSAGCRSSSQGRGLAQPLAGKPAAAVPELPHEGTSSRSQMHDVRQSSKGTGILRNALPALQEVGRPDDGEEQSVHSGSEGLRDQSDDHLQGGRLPIENAREGILLETRDAVSPWIAGQDQHHQGGSHGKSMGYQTYAVRRLTPRECERLQSFPDDHTLIPIRPIKPSRAEALLAKGDPAVLIGEQWWAMSVDGPRYKALGNSMCVYNMRWIGRRIADALSRAHEREIARFA